MSPDGLACNGRGIFGRTRAGRSGDLAEVDLDWNHGVLSGLELLAEFQTGAGVEGPGAHAAAG